MSEASETKTALGPNKTITNEDFDRLVDDLGPVANPADTGSDVNFWRDVADARTETNDRLVKELSQLRNNLDLSHKENGGYVAEIERLTYMAECTKDVRDELARLSHENRRLRDALERIAKYEMAESEAVWLQSLASDALKASDGK